MSRRNPETNISKGLYRYKDQLYSFLFIGKVKFGQQNIMSVVYKCMKDGRIYIREREDFVGKFSKIEADDNQR